MAQKTAYITAEVLPNGNLKIVASEECVSDLRERLASDPDAFDSLELTHEVLSPLVENDEYEWTEPHFCGALTSAPMLAIYGDEAPVPVGMDTAFLRTVGSDGSQVFFTPIEKCWAFMDYAITSPQRRLVENGHCVFQSGQE